MPSVKDALDKADALWAQRGSDVNALPEAIRTVHLIGQLDFEVNLGGVLGWLTNSSGRYASETAQALDAVGARECASIIRRINAVFPTGSPPTDDRARAQEIQRLLPDAHSAWRELGDALLAWPDDITSLLEVYVTKHQSDFK
jgi:hypothetical protein